MPLPGLVTPTLDTNELEKRITDLKAVEGWLKSNLSMLQMTIQGLEMQSVTLNAVRAMGQMSSNFHPGAAAGDEAQTPQALFPGAAGGSEGLKQAAMWPWTMMQQMQEQMQKAAAAIKDGQSQDEPKP